MNLRKARSIAIDAAFAATAMQTGIPIEILKDTKYRQPEHRDARVVFVGKLLQFHPNEIADLTGWQRHTVNRLREDARNAKDKASEELRDLTDLEWAQVRFIIGITRVKYGCLEGLERPLSEEELREGYARAEIHARYEIAGRLVGQLHLNKATAIAAAKRFGIPLHDDEIMNGRALVMGGHQMSIARSMGWKLGVMRANGRRDTEMAKQLQGGFEASCWSTAALCVEEKAA